MFFIIIRKSHLHMTKFLEFWKASQCSVNVNREWCTNMMSDSLTDSCQDKQQQQQKNNN